MPQIASHDQVRDSRSQRDVPGGHHVRRTDFIAAPADRPELPQAFLIESTPGHHLRTHFHEVDQFQVVVGGGGTLAKHVVAPPGVHFARRFTPYGPLINGAGGIQFFTLRACRDPGRAQFIPDRRERLDEIPDRKPWQVTALPDFTPAPRPEGVALNPIPGVSNGQGLGAWTLVMAAGGTTTLPDPSAGDGQYVLVLQGSLLHGGRDYPGYSVMWVEPGEGAQAVCAGVQGLEALVLNFPARDQPPVPARLHAAGEAWHCTLCDFVYDEAAGLPAYGIAPGTPWSQVPADFTCPDCAAGKDGFDKLAL